MVDAAFNGVGGEKPVTPGTAKSNANRKLEEHEVTVEIDTNGNGDETKSSKELENHDKQPDPSVPYWKLYMFADKLDVLLIILGILGAIGNGVSQPVMTILFGQIINSFGSNQTDTRKMIDEVSKVALRFVYLGIASGAASYLQISCWICAGERQSARIRSLYLKQIMRQDVVFFDMDTTTGEVVARMSGDTVLIADAVGEKAGKFIMGIATFFGGYAIAFSRNWKLTLVMLSAIPLMIGAGGIMSMQISTMSTRAQESYAAAGSLVEQVVGAMRTVSSFTGENKAVEEYDKALMSAEKEGSRQGWVTGLGFGVLIGLVFASYSLALWYGGQLVVNEGANGGEVLNVIFAVLTGGLAMGQTSPSISAFALGRAAAYKMFQVIDRVPEIDVYDKSGIIPDNVKADIEFRNVQFHYPTRPDYQIFSNFSLSIPSGKTIALVGESGSGKSTVISLIERFYDPQGGAVLLDKVNIKDLQLKWLRQQIALVSQEPVLFSASIKDNIGYGKDGATFAEIQSAAALANAAKFISKIPKEYETLVGERGVQLSGGQKQRIAIARAILRNPQILLLDEATSALDAQSEHLVQDALDRIMVDRTTVVVAHRLTTVRNADLIAVLQRGAIVETGSHDELVRSPNGAYSQLIRLQEISGAQAGSEAVNEVDPDDIPEKNSVIDSLTKSSSQKAVLESSSSKGGSYRRSFSLLRSHPIGKIADNLQGDLDKDSLSRTVGDIGSTHQEGLQKDMSIFRLATLNKPEIPWFIAGSVAAACSGLTFPVFGLLLSSAINAFYEPPGKLRKDINFWAFMFLIMAIGVLAVSPVQMGSFAIIGNRLVRRVRRLTYEKILQQEIGWFDEGVNSSGALGARLAGDATSIKSLVADSLALLVQNIASIASGLIIAFTGSWQLSLVVLAILPVLSLQGFYNMKAMNGFNTKAKEQYEEASKVANDAVSSMRTVASFSAEEKVCELYDMRCVLPVKTGIRQGLISGTALAVANFGMFACNGLCFWVGGKLVDRGETTFKDVFRTFFAVTLSTIGIAQAAGLAPDVSKVKSAVKSIFSIVDRDSKIDPTNMNGLTLKMVKGDIVLDHVEFRYPTRLDFPIFKDFSLSVEAGKTVAIVGESGSGKSTVISLIERFYDPISGKVLLDGKDIKSLQLKWYRQQIGLVSQEPVLFNETIRWNITYGKEGGVTQHEIQTVAESANAHKFITGFPDGYETRVGERGVQLSGGQKQRVAIARAILKNPRVLLLDEATSALDAESEHVVQEALDRVMVNRTTVVVAHRLSTIRNADLIAVVQGGVIVEQGTHNDLLERGTGAYAALVRLHMNSDS